MAIDWLWTIKSKTDVTPAIGDQYIAMGESVLCLRNPWPADSAFMGKMYATTIAILAPYFLISTSQAGYEGQDLYLAYLTDMIFPLFVFLLLLYRIFFIKNLSNFYLNRHTNKIYYKRNKKLFVCEWPSAQGGFFSRLEFGGRSFSTSFALALKLTSIDKEDPESPITLWVDSNEPGDPRVEYVAQVWEYIRQFMAHGPDNLPPPQAPDWWHVPHNNICLTPRQAFRHYAPWRTGEPGEEKAKQWWMLPFWAVLFPYNLFAALCWWATCRLFNVRPAEAPPKHRRKRWKGKPCPWSRRRWPYVG